MAHFAEIDDSTTVEGGYLVLRVIVVDNSVLFDPDGDVEVESNGVAFLENLLPGSGPWVQGSYNSFRGPTDRNFRGKFPGIGDVWRSDLNGSEGVFLSPQPYPSWTLDTTRWDYLPPSMHADDDKVYSWDEDTTSWVEVEVE